MGEAVQFGLESGVWRALGIGVDRVSVIVQVFFFYAVCVSVLGRREALHPGLIDHGEGLMVVLCASLSRWEEQQGNGPE